MEKPVVCITDDNPEIREVVHIMLKSEGFCVLEAADGQELLELVRHEKDTIDLFILDVMMPGLDGFEVCRRLRMMTHAPVLFLTAKSQEPDKLEGLSSGGDDYLVKPFSAGELAARVRALLRRYTVYQGKEPARQEEVLCVEDVELHTAYNEARRQGTVIPLTDLEYRILLLMAKNRRKIFTAKELYETVWGEPFLLASGNTVMVHIRNLRKKLERDPQNPRIIKNVWGKGYRIE